MDKNRFGTASKDVGGVCCGGQSNFFWGSVLLLFGALLLAGTQFPLIGLGRYLFPAFLLLWGGWKVWTAARQPQ